MTTFQVFAAIQIRITGMFHMGSKIASCMHDKKVPNATNLSLLLHGVGCRLQEEHLP